MGSIDKACISGFLCRLCSEMHRIVIHIYTYPYLVEKINGYLPITISPSDPLPKTICNPCLRRVEQHYELLVRLTRIKKERERVHKISVLSSSEISEEEEDLCYDEHSTAVETSQPTSGRDVHIASPTSHDDSISAIRPIQATHTSERFEHNSNDND